MSPLSSKIKIKNNKRTPKLTFWTRRKDVPRPVKQTLYAFKRPEQVKIFSLNRPRGSLKSGADPKSVSFQ